MICSVRDESAERSATAQRPHRTDLGVPHRDHERLGALVIIPVFYAFAMGVDRPIVAEVRA